MKIKFSRKSAVILIAIILISVLGVLVFNILPDSIDNNSESANQSLLSEENYISFNGKKYKEKNNIDTVLVMGVDKFANPDKAEGYNNSQQTDFLMLFVMDTNAKTYNVVQINRDTMSEIQVLGVNGEHAGNTTAQLALAHTYGSGGVDSCRNTTKAVSNLLYNVRINHFVAFTMDAVSEINDIAGGVNLEVMNDFSELYPEMEKGAMVTLDGDMALTYVRARKGLDDSSNVARMERQHQYLEALEKQISYKVKSDDEFATRLLNSISDYITTDYNGNQISRLYDRIETYKYNGFDTIEGETVKGEEFMEFYADEDALKELVIKLFYEPVD